MLDSSTIVTVLVIGLVAGWLAHLLMGFGTLGRDLGSGLLGALIGSILTGGFGVPMPFGNPLVNDIVLSTIGAVAVITVARLIAWRSRSRVDAL